MPLMKHPSDVFLETLESSLMNIVLRNNSAVCNVIVIQNKLKLFVNRILKIG